jgi:hypothetical protein
MSEALELFIEKKKRENTNIDEYQWNKDDLMNIGKIGLTSDSFVDDDEDYSKW